MKKLLLIALVTFFGFSANAQVKTPQPSPLSKMEQKVGLTDVTIEYSRPAVRGRKIFGDLVPYGKMWRTGANANTKVTFSDDVKIGDSNVKAGTYAIFTIPNEKSWDILVYADASNWGTPEKWDDSKVVAKVGAEVYAMPMSVESFTVSVDDISNNSAVIGMIWENVYVGMPFTVPTAMKVSASIDETMKGDPKAGDYYSAAVYYLQEKMDMKKAMMWIDKAVEMTSDNPRFWYMRQQSLIHAAGGDKAGAIEAAKKSLAGAEAAGNADYVKMNKDSLKEWGGM
ncbi:MAG: dihydrolipoamide dehydrogenase [Bacteroidetes bacterium MedPE-SWsnd-G2]|nr:MAG: dihydrolipoamide dehydrogenase [Bacteroidetes bacterium MedPE-SWsnd-G2]